MESRLLKCRGEVARTEGGPRPEVLTALAPPCSPPPLLTRAQPPLHPLLPAPAPLQVMMPAGAANSRGAQKSALAGVMYDKKTDPTVRGGGQPGWRGGMGLRNGEKESAWDRSSRRPSSLAAETIAVPLAPMHLVPRGKCTSILRQHRNTAPLTSPPQRHTTHTHTHTHTHTTQLGALLETLRAAPAGALDPVAAAVVRDASKDYVKATALPKVGVERVGGEGWGGGFEGI